MCQIGHQSLAIIRLIFSSTPTPHQSIKGRARYPLRSRSRSKCRLRWGIPANQRPHRHNSVKKRGGGGDHPLICCKPATAGPLAGLRSLRVLRQLRQRCSGLNLALALPRYLTIPKQNTWRNFNNVIEPQPIGPGGKLTWAQEPPLHNHHAHHRKREKRGAIQLSRSSLHQYL